MDQQSIMLYLRLKSMSAVAIHKILVDTLGFDAITCSMVTLYLRDTQFRPRQPSSRRRANRNTWWNQRDYHGRPGRTAILFYRLVDKYMRQPRLMRTRRIFIYKNCLSSDVVSISFTYFLNSAHPSLKYGIQFLLIQTLQNLLQTFKNWSSSASWIRSSFSLTIGNM
jgi:hypothetical protein